jgi:hypothetical protein
VPSSAASPKLALGGIGVPSTSGGARGKIAGERRRLAPAHWPGLDQQQGELVAAEPADDVVPAYSTGMPCPAGAILPSTKEA